MSKSFSLGQVVAIILVSSTLSVGANLAITSYAPGLVPMIFR